MNHHLRKIALLAMGLLVWALALSARPAAAPADDSAPRALYRISFVRAAGFESSSAIGPYMRSLIHMHRDTMGVAIKF